MFDATRLLGTLLQNRSTPSAASRLSAGLNGAGPGGGTIGQLLSQFGGGSQGGGLSGLMSALTGSGRGSTGGDNGRGERFAAMARQAVASPGQELQRNNPLAVGGLGALAGTLLAGGRGAVGGGLLAVIGSLAYSALQAGGQGAPEAASPSTALPGAGPASTTPWTAPAGTAAPAAGQGGYSKPQTAEPVPVTAAADPQRAAMLVLRSMIQAAKADGQIDGQEIERITGKLDEGADAAEARGFVLDQMRGPADLDGLVRDVRTPQEAAEVYGAALMAIEVDTDAERDYLARLAAGLGLSQPTVAYLHHSLGLPIPTA